MKLLYLVLSTAFLFAPFTINAQELDTTRFYVSDVLFANNGYVAGETVTGTFLFHNLTNETVARAAYRVELVELLDNGNGVYPSDALDASAHIPLTSVVPGSSEISFMYVLPEHIPNANLGILVQTYLGDANTPAALEYVPIVITGDHVTYVERAATLIVNNEEFYDTLAGPTVDRTEKTELEVYLGNTTESAVQLQPTLRIVAGSTSTGNEVFTEQVPTVSVPANGQYTFNVPLPVGSLSAGVYTVLLNATHVGTGVPAFAPLEVRLVVAGLTPKIEHVTYNTFDVTAPDASFDVSVTYLETPINFRTHSDGTPKDDRVLWATEEKSVEEWIRAMGMSARIELKNVETGDVIAQQEVPFTTATTVTVPFGRIVGTPNVDVHITLLQRGNEIDTFSEVITLTVEERTSWQAWIDAYPLPILGGGIVLVCVLVLALGIGMLRRKNKRALQNQIIG